MNAARMRLLLAAATLSVTAHAEAQSAPEPVGRLFFTPERRAALERQRQLNLREVQSLQGETIAFDGVVRRSSGRSTTWVNGVPQHDQAVPSGMLLVPSPAGDGRASLRTGNEALVGMKVGESFNRSTRERWDVLGAGRVIVNRTAGAASPGDPPHRSRGDR